MSQLVDSTAIITILYLANNLGPEIDTIGAVIILIVNSYLFNFAFAIIDTPLMYLGVRLFKDFEEDSVQEKI